MREEIKIEDAYNTFVFEYVSMMQYEFKNVCLDEAYIRIQEKLEKFQSSEFIDDESLSYYDAVVAFFRHETSIDTLIEVEVKAEVKPTWINRVKSFLKDFSLWK